MTTLFDINDTIKFTVIGTIKSFSRLICLILSAVAAMIVVGMLIRNYGSTATETLMAEFNVETEIPAEAKEIMAISPTLTQYASILVMGLFLTGKILPPSCKNVDCLLAITDICVRGISMITTCFL